MRKNCTRCIHYTICSNNDLILDPLHGGVPCKDYDSIDNYIPKETPVDKPEKFWRKYKPMKLIKTWEELAGLESENYRVEVDLDTCSGWIVPQVETEETEEKYFEHHWYLSTHTFYGRSYAQYTKLFQKLGFDIELDNWDKEGQSNG